MKAPNHSYIYVDWQISYFEVSLSYEDWQENRSWVARCPELQLSDYGETQREAIDNLMEMIKATLFSAIEKEILSPMLRKLGFKRSRVPIPKREYYILDLKQCEKFKPLPNFGEYFQKPQVLAQPHKTQVHL